jgi:hypothetical protein
MQELGMPETALLVQDATLQTPNTDLKHRQTFRCAWKHRFSFQAPVALTVPTTTWQQVGANTASMKQTNFLLGVMYSNKHTGHTAAPFANTTPQLAPDQSSILHHQTGSVGGYCT